MASYCQHCGSPISAGAQFCPSCGQPVNAQEPMTRIGSYPPTPVSPPPVQRYAPPPLPVPPAQQYVPPQQPPPPPQYNFSPPQVSTPPPGQYYPPAPPPGSSSGGCGRTALIVVVILILLSLCCVAAVVGTSMYSGVSIWNQLRQFSPENLIPQSTLEALLPTGMGNLMETVMPQLTLDPSTLLTAGPGGLNPSTLLTAVPGGLDPSLMQTASAGGLNPSDLLTSVPGGLDPSTLLSAVPKSTGMPILGTPMPPGNGKSILLDYSTQWSVKENNQYVTDISQQGDWAIGVKQPALSVAALIPQQPDSSAAAVTVTLNLSTRAPNQIAGVRCMLQDENNYYQGALRNKSFAILKVLDGKPVPLTSPEWKPSQFIGSKGLVGGAAVIVTCNPNGIGLTVNGTEETPLVPDPDSSFSSGRVAVFVTGANQSSAGYTGYAVFGKVKASN